MACKTIQIDDFDDFFAKIDRSRNMVYRGQPVDAPLVPTVARPWVQSPEWFTTVRKREQYAYKQFRRLSRIYGEIPTDVCDFIAYAQHHGLKTRLLDWTENPFAALFFSVEAEQVSQAVVWQLETEEEDFLSSDPTYDNLFNPSRTMLYRPNHVTPRIVAQRGLFSIMRLSDIKGWPLEQLARFQDRLTKFVINEPPKWIRQQLDKFNVNVATMYPDAASLAKQVSFDSELQFPYRKRLTLPYVDAKTKRVRLTDKTIMDLPK